MTGHEHRLEKWAAKGLMLSMNLCQKEQHMQRLVDMNSHDLTCEFDNVLTIKYDKFENRDRSY